MHNLKDIKTSLQKIATYAPDYNSLLERVSSLVIEFDDITEELDRCSDKLINDPEQLDLINQKLQLIYNLQKKHQVDSVEGLLEIQTGLEQAISDLSNLESDIEKLTLAIKDKSIILDELALAIHTNRIVAIPVLSDKLIAILDTLGMPNVRFDIQLKQGETYLQNGKDELQFLFAANKGTDFGLLRKVASGGEMSRIMLAVKAILAHYSKLPTLIFDEIDTGVSGEIAIKMGEIMEDMSKTMQIFAITHLPQIAAKGNVHFKVFKSTVGEDTQSELKLLSDDERVVEIAQMLSGTVVSDSALNHAKALLN
jgi:DNA repair protein RecN (Recombination protein N)